MLTKIMSFAMSIASRGLGNSKIDINVKKLRHISCFGYKNIKPCINLKKSNKSEYFYCDGCNCGDHSHTWLEREPNEYAKLDYPFLSCPLKMPGFSNYDPNNPKEEIERKKQIENMNPEEFQYIELTISVDEEKQKIFERVNNIIKNS